VDVGVHQDGLVHVSELANRFVRDPAEVAKVGDRVRVKVIKIDGERRRIGLSLKQAPASHPGTGAAS
jgi:protein Tex